MPYHTLLLELSPNLWWCNLEWTLAKTYLYLVSSNFNSTSFPDGLLPDQLQVHTTSGLLPLRSQSVSQVSFDLHSVRFAFFLPFVKPLYSSTVQHRLPFLVSALLHCFIVSSALYIIITRWYPFVQRISVLTHSLKIFGIVVTWQKILWRSEENLFYRCTLFLHVSTLSIIFFDNPFPKNLNLHKVHGNTISDRFSSHKLVCL